MSPYKDSKPGPSTMWCRLCTEYVVASPNKCIFIVVKRKYILCTKINKKFYYQKIYLLLTLSFLDHYATYTEVLSIQLQLQQCCPTCGTRRERERERKRERERERESVCADLCHIISEIRFQRHNTTGPQNVI